jgi:hypothetical protein
VTLELTDFRLYLSPDPLNGLDVDAELPLMQTTDLFRSLVFCLKASFSIGIDRHRSTGQRAAQTPDLKKL